MDRDHRVALLHGGMDADEREQLRLAFQADPTEHPVRILLATDAASEGIDLQSHCHRLVNYDIPFNPNRLEQRIGRIDRYGQRVAPDIRHFVGTGWRQRRRRVRGRPGVPGPGRAQGRHDARPTSARSTPCSPTPCSGAMLGEPVDLDVETRRRRPPAHGRAGRHRRAASRSAGCASQLDATVAELRHHPGRDAPGRRHRAGAGPAAAAAPHLDDRHADDRLFDVPPLTGSWERATAGLAEKLERRPPTSQRPVTFDPAAPRRRRDDVVLAHLNHPLVAMSTRLLRAAVSQPDIGLHRVTAVVTDDPALEDVLVGAFSRFVLVGARRGPAARGGAARRRLGAGRRPVPALENLGLLGASWPATRSPPAARRRRPSRPGWPSAGRGSRDGVLAAIDWRIQTRASSRWSAARPSRSAGRARPDRRANFDRFAQHPAPQLAEDDRTPSWPLFSRAEAAKSRDESAQYRRDRRSGQSASTSSTQSATASSAAIAAATPNPQPHRFPVAVVFVVPRREARAR